MSEEQPTLQQLGISEKLSKAPFPTGKERESLDPALRSPRGFSDDMRIYRANIYEVMGPNDDRLKVRPLPHFIGIPKDEEEFLPMYPPFEKGTLVTGKSEKFDGEKAEQVWVLATPDFQLGYVLFKANPFGENVPKRYAWSYDYNKVKAFVAARRAKPEDFDYDHLDVVKWYATEEGGAIELFNHRTGDWYLINSSGSIITVQQKRIYMRVGTPPDPMSAGPVGYSSITMNADEIVMDSSNIVMKGRKIILGHGNQNVVGTTSSAPIIGYNGTEAHKIPHVYA